MGRQIVALDTSSGAIEVCRRRSLTSTFLGTVDDLAATGPLPFDSFLALNSLSHVFGSTEAVALDALRAMGHSDSALVGTIRDPYRTDDAVHLAYQTANRAAGRMSGEVRWRTRFQRLADPWFSTMWASREELAEMADRVGWRLVETTPAADDAAQINTSVNTGAVYGAVLRPQPS
jgi:hypothetical protein